MQTENGATAPWPRPGIAWYAVVILVIAFIFSFIDRIIIAMLVEPLKQDLGLSDTQLGLLQGLAFAVFYATVGLPIGRLADRRSRRAIIGWGIFLWSIMTAVCGLARNFWELFLARVGVGVGEAALSPAAYSMIADYFPREKLGRALGVYQSGAFFGAGLSFLVGGLVIQAASRAGEVSLPFLGEVRAWQLVFFAVGLPGVLVALLMLTVREPERRGRLQIRQADGTVTEQLSVRATVGYLASRWRTYLTHFVGMTVVTIQGYSFFFWVPELFVRTWQWTIPQVSLAYGLVTIIGGPIGILLGGWIADRLYQRGHKDALMRTCLGGALLLLIPGSILTPLMPTPELALAMLVPVSLGGAMVTATGAAALQIITPNQMRAQATAVYYFVINIFGLLGPTAVAAVTDFAFADDAALRWSLAIVCAIASVVGIVALRYNLPHYRASVVEAEGWGRGR